MAQTKKKRQTKHRGNAAGVVTNRGRTGRPPSPEEKKRQEREQARTTRLTRPPSWKVSTRNSALMAAFIFLFLMLTQGHKGSHVASAIFVALLAFVIYTPAGYYMERFMWKRRTGQGKGKK